MCLWQCFIDVADVFDVDVDTELDDDIVVEIDDVSVKIDVKAVKGAAMAIITVMIRPRVS